MRTTPSYTCISNFWVIFKVYNVSTFCINKVNKASSILNDILKSSPNTIYWLKIISNMCLFLKLTWNPKNMISITCTLVVEGVGVRAPCMCLLKIKFVKISGRVSSLYMYLYIIVKADNKKGTASFLLLYARDKAFHIKYQLH